MVAISTELINFFTESNRNSELNGTEFKWGYEVTLQRVLWLIGISSSFAFSTLGLFMMCKLALWCRVLTCYICCEPAAIIM